jgi:Bacterial antitoxin of type II TA system, VapB
VKTTIEINDDLLRQAKIRAAERGETLRELVERGLRHELETSGSAPAPYEMPDGRFRGAGSSVDELDWDKIRDEATRWRVSSE